MLDLLIISVESSFNGSVRSLLLAGLVQVCGRVWWPVSSWSVPWQPCSGSSTTRSRSTSACPAHLPPRCQSPSRRSWAWLSEASLPPRSPPPSHWAAYSVHTGRLSINSSSAHGSFLYLCLLLLQLLLQLLRLHVYILKQKGLQKETSLLVFTESEPHGIFLRRNTCFVLSFLVIR